MVNQYITFECFNLSKFLICKMVLRFIPLEGTFEPIFALWAIWCQIETESSFLPNIIGGYAKIGSPKPIRSGFNCETFGRWRLLVSVIFFVSGILGLDCVLDLESTDIFFYNTYLYKTEMNNTQIILTLTLSIHSFNSFKIGLFKSRILSISISFLR